MTVIEFFDKAAIKNIASALLCKPDRVIMVGNDVKPIKKSFEYFRPVMTKHGKTVDFIAKSANRNNVQEIIEVLSDIVENYEDCVFDLTGGEDLYLVAVGAIMNKYGHRVQCHRFDFKNETLIDCDADGCVCDVDSFDVSIDDMIEMHGGKIVTNPYDRYYREPWKLTRELGEDVSEMWDCMINPGSMICHTAAWNATMSCIGEAYRRFAEEDSLELSFSLRDVDASLAPGASKHWFVPWIMSNLKNRDIIYHYTMVGNRVSFKFKDHNIKRIMTVAGQLLELRIAFALKALVDNNGEPYFHDIRVGVVIDWDPESQRSTEDTRAVNEIDVIAMHGAIPFFISCKNGGFNSDELYKFNTVANLFGSDDVKKVMVCSDMEHTCADPDTLRERMDEMGIKRIENVHQRTGRALQRTLCGVFGSDCL